jgi:hypothetical protein
MFLTLVGKMPMLDTFDQPFGRERMIQENKSVDSEYCRLSNPAQ